MEWSEFDKMGLEHTQFRILDPGLQDPDRILDLNGIMNKMKEGSFDELKKRIELDVKGINKRNKIQQELIMYFPCVS